MRIKRKFFVISAICMLANFAPQYSVYAAYNQSIVDSSSEITSILDNYHDELNQMQADNTASIQSTGSVSSLTVSTVKKLNNAGYEAYLVNGDSYNNVEEELSTDFDEIGLSKNESYIIVCSGEDSIDDTISPSSTTGSSFNYTYNGTTYKMRYLTITAADNSSYGQANYVNLFNTKSQTVIKNALNTSVNMLISSYSKTAGLISSICGLDITDFLFTQRSTMNLHGAANWTRIYTQVYSSYDKTWMYGAFVEKVAAKSYCAGDYYSAEKNEYVSVPQNKKSWTKESSKYNDTTWRKKYAAIGFTQGCQKDKVGDVKITYGGVTKMTFRENF